MYAHSHLSRILSTGPNRALFYMHNTILGPGAMSLNQYLESHSFSNPTDHHDAPFQYGHKTTLDLWAYLQEKPARSKIFNEHMRSSAIVGSSALPPFPFSTELKCDSDEEVLLVDIGGGKGQALQSILNAYPNMKGRMIVQDLREVIQDAESSAHLPPSIETMASDFFKPQPVKGAKAYFMRRIMHDWGDKECKLILENIISSMTEDSKLLINDLVLPQEGCHRRMALNDIAMMIL
jgi:O-methyltransferase domain